METAGSVGPDVLSASFGADGLLADLSPAWEPVLGLPPHRLAGTPFLALFEDGDREAARACAERAGTGRRPDPLELACRRPDGSFVWVSWTLSPAGPRYVRVEGRVVAQPESADAEVRARANFAELGVMAAVFAHDLNNVLAMISASAGLVRQGAGLTTEQLRDLADLDDGVAQGAEMVRRVIAHCRRVPAADGRTDVNEVVGRLNWMLRHVARKNVDVDLILARQIPPVAAQESVVAQSLLNLLINARDAMPGGGRITVKTEPVEVSASFDPRLGLAPGTYVALSVSDTGTGIAPGVRERLFEPFFTTKPSGTGLGLFAVHRAMERCGGAVRVENGRFSTRFTLYFPPAPGSVP